MGFDRDLVCSERGYTVWEECMNGSCFFAGGNTCTVRCCTHHMVHGQVEDRQRWVAVTKVFRLSVVRYADGNINNISASLQYLSR